MDVDAAPAVVNEYEILKNNIALAIEVVGQVFQRFAIQVEVVVVAPGRGLSNGIPGIDGDEFCCTTTSCRQIFWALALDCIALSR